MLHISLKDQAQRLVEPPSDLLNEQSLVESLGHHLLLFVLAGATMIFQSTPKLCQHILLNSIVRFYIHK